MPSDNTTTSRVITKVGHRYQVKGDPQLHLSECLLIVFPDDPVARPGVEGVRCTCNDDFYPEPD